MSSQSGGINQEIEKRLVEDYRKELFDLIENLQDTSGHANGNLRKSIEQKLSIYHKHLSSYGKQFPTDKDLDWYESVVYVISAYLKLSTTGFAHRAVDRSDNLGATLIFAAMAKGQNDSNAREAIQLFDRALQLDDNPGVRMAKASIHSSLHEKQAALKEVNYILENFSEEQDLYLEARKLKDEIEEGKDKCFIATVVYGSSTADEVVLLRHFRDTTLLRSKLGRKMVTFYYKYSPHIACKLSNSNLLKTLVKKGMLVPIIWCVSKYTKTQETFTYSERK